MAYFGQPWNGAPVAAMRAAHADRERTVDVLKAAFAEGRLTQDEYEQRVDLAHRATTYGELGRLVGDLPAGPLPGLVYPPAVQPVYPPAVQPAYPLAVPQAFLPPLQAPPPPLNSLAAASLMLGVAGLVLGVPAIPAIVLGYKARSEIRAGAGSGERAAAAGLVLGWLVVSLWGLIALVVGLL